MKTITFIECERCGGSFSDDTIHLYKDPIEQALCDGCASYLESVMETV